MKQSTQLIKKVEDVGELGSVSEPAPSVSYVVPNESDRGVHLRDYWRALRKRLWLALGLPLVVTMIVAIYVARKPDIFEAQAQVQVDLENNMGLGGMSKNSSIIFNNPVSDPTYFNTQLQILTSPRLLRRVVRALDLEHDQAFLNPQSFRKRSTWQSVLRMFGLGEKDEPAKIPAVEAIPQTTSSAPAVAQDDMGEAKRLAPYVASLLVNLRVEPVKEKRSTYYRDTRLIDIRFNHTDPQVAAKIVNSIADSFARSNLEKKTETNSNTGDFLQKRIADLQSEIRRDEEDLGKYARSNQILSLDASQNTVVERLVGLNRQLLEAENDRKLAEAAYRSALTPGAAGALAEGDAKQIVDAEFKLGELRQKRAQLLIEATEEAPEVKEINQQIGVLEPQIKEARNRATSTVLTNLETRYRSALAREEALRASFHKQKSETINQNEAAVNYRIIQQEIETNKNLLEGLLQRSKENEVVLAGTPNNVYVLDYAIVPDVPIGPARLRTVFLSILLSLGFGIGLVFFLEYMDDTVSSTDEVERLLHLPTLAAIPSTSSLTRPRLRRPQAGAVQPHNGNGNGNKNSELLLNADPHSPLAEAYRQLRTSVLLSTAGGAPKTLLVTSSLPGEGKTTTCVNVAISLAQTGASVVVVDADMRRPRQHSIFGLKNELGLSTILSSKVGEAGILGIVQPHEKSSLHLLTSGPIPPNPAELIGSEQMRHLVTTLEDAFTYVIIDSPPIGSFTDGVLASSLADGVLLVIHSGKTSAGLVMRSRQMLLDVGAKIFGIVLNNLTRRSEDYYYYHHYYVHSYYKAPAGNDEAAPQA